MPAPEFEENCLEISKQAMPNPDKKEERKELEPAETHKEFWVLVNYYEGRIPYAMIVDQKDGVSKYDLIYKVKIPYAQPRTK